MLSYNDLQHYPCVVGALGETIRAMAAIDEAIARHGGWSLARGSRPEFVLVRTTEEMHMLQTLQASFRAFAEYIRELVAARRMKQPMPPLAAAQRRPVLIGAVLSAFGILVVLSLCSSLINAATTSANGIANTSVSAHAQGTKTAPPKGAPPPTATAQPTSKASATPTAATTAGTNATGGQAVLGGTLDAFIPKWGQPTNFATYLYGFQRQCGSLNNDWCLMMLLFPGTNNLNYVQSLTVTSPDDASGNPIWDLTLARAACSTYLPADARYQRELPVIQNGSTVGLDRIYTSQQLARIFPASAFTDAQQNPVTPGTFDEMFLYGNNPGGSQIDGCTITVGTTQTG